MNELDQIIKQIIDENISNLGKETLKEELPQAESPMTANVSGGPSCFGEEKTEEKTETKLLSPNGMAHFHNHGCIVSNYTSMPVKAICTEMSNRGQRSYYVRLDEA